MTIKKSEFKQRRKRLMRQVGKGNIAIVPSAEIRVRNRDVDYPYRQDSNFYYLTGFDEPEAIAVLIPGRKQAEYIIFCREFDEKQAMWTGEYAGLEGACHLYGADDAFPIEDLDEILPGLLENRERVFYPFGQDKELDQQVLEWVHVLRNRSRAGIDAPVELVSLEHVVHDMRIHKSPAEIKIMRQAAQVSAQAHVRAMKACKAGLYEYQLEAELIYEFMRHGMRSPAYPSIVAGGHNACVLHYIDNKDVLKAGDLLLIDAGAEHERYAADITRTFPVSGRFNEAQKALYELVLKAQLAGIDQVKPGNRWNEPHEAVLQVLTKGLVKLGLLKGRVSKLIKDEAYKPFYMHKTGHWLGMDVHDVGKYKINDQWRILEPGMVLTIEPGLYIPQACQAVDKQWWGMGIRIEDDILVTEKGHEVMSHEVPKTVSEIEQLMRG